MKAVSMTQCEATVILILNRWLFISGSVQYFLPSSKAQKSVNNVLRLVLSFPLLCLVLICIFVLVLVYWLFRLVHVRD